MCLQGAFFASWRPRILFMCFGSAIGRFFLGARVGGHSKPRTSSFEPLRPQGRGGSLRVRGDLLRSAVLSRRFDWCCGVLVTLPVSSAVGCCSCSSGSRLQASPRRLGRWRGQLKANARRVGRFHNTFAPRRLARHAGLCNGADVTNARLDFAHRLFFNVLLIRFATK